MRKYYTPNATVHNRVSWRQTEHVADAQIPELFLGQFLRSLVWSVALSDASFIHVSCVQIPGFLLEAPVPGLHFSGIALNTP